MSIQCSQCGAVNPDEAIFCKKCGGQLRGESSTDVPHHSPVRRSTVEGSGHSQTRWKVLDSPDPFPDKAAKYKLINILVFVTVNLVVWCNGSPDVLRNILGGLALGAMASFFVHILICNIALGLISLPLNRYKYWLPREISEVDLARKLSEPLSELNLGVKLNPGLTGGLLIGDGHITYQVTLVPYERYFRVLSGSVSHYATYDCIIRDTPRIAYAIQQELL